MCIASENSFFNIDDSSQEDVTAEDYLEMEEIDLIEEISFEDECFGGIRISRGPRSNKTCSECGMVCADSLELIEHLKSHKDSLSFSDNTNDGSSKSKRSKKFPCSECNKLFESPSKVARHKNFHLREKQRTEKYGVEFMMKKKTRPKNYSCDFCQKKWETPSKVIRHINQVHMKRDGESFTADPFTSVNETIPSTTSNTPQPVEIIIPRKKYEVINKHECDTCSKKFPSPSKLQKHRNVHRKEEQKMIKYGAGYRSLTKKNYECLVCGKMWESPSKLKR